MKRLTIILSLLIVGALTQADLVHGTPPPYPQSYVDPCFVICPEGDFDFHVVVKDWDAVPVPGAEIRIDFSLCPNVVLCKLDGSEAYTIEDGMIIAIADTAGAFTFNIRGGGTCPEPGALIYANGVALAYRPVASPDQDGNLAVEDPGDVHILQDKYLNNPSDPTADFDCDSNIGLSDIDILQDHLGHECIEPDAEQSSVDSCFSICPEGDSGFVVVVKDALGNPIAGAETMIDLCNCPDIWLCEPHAGDAYTIENACKAVGISDASGTFTFELRGGGTCPAANATISADGVALATRSITSPDQDGNGGVNQFDEAALQEMLVNNPLDPAGDLNCDGVIDNVDLTLLTSHMTHCCPELIDVPEGPPTQFRDALLPCVPNPTSRGSILRFTASREQIVDLVVLDVRGTLVSRVWSGVKAAGYHAVEWDGMDRAGLRVPPGVYFVQLSGDRFVDSTKLVRSR